jgi:hypothetical protein
MMAADSSASHGMTKKQTTASATANTGILRCAQDDDIGSSITQSLLLKHGMNADSFASLWNDNKKQTTASATANTGILCCAQDDDIDGAKT